MIPSPEIIAEGRLQRLTVGFLVAAGVLIVRLGWIQFACADGYRDDALAARTESRELPAGRGEIHDRNGLPLVERVESFALSVLPVEFRERNRIDALGDLIVALRPDLVSWSLDVMPTELVPFARRRLERHRAIAGQARRLVAGLLGVRCADIPIDGDAATVRERLAAVAWPFGELVLPPSRLSRRVIDALLVLADDERIDTRNALRRRLREADTVGEALALDVDRAVTALIQEVEDVASLAQTPSDGDEFFLRLFEREAQDLRRQERRVEEFIHDRIAVGRFGTHELEMIDAEEHAALVAEIGEPDDDLVRLEAEWAEYAGLDRNESDAADRARIEAVQRILDGRPMDRLDQAERRAIARVLGVFVESADELKVLMGRRLVDDESGRREWLSAEKEWARRLQFKGGVPYEVIRGADFAAAVRVTRSFGLARLGFSARSEYGRRYWQDDVGRGVFLIGRANAVDHPLGGLEATLTFGRDGEPGPLAGRPGRLKRRREPDRRVTELAGSIAPVHGSTVRLTIDCELQAAVEDVLGAFLRANPGAVGSCAAVIDLDTGDVLTLAQVPLVSGAEWLVRWDEDAARTRERRAAARARARGEFDDASFTALRNRQIVEADRRPAYDRAADAGAFTRYPPGSIVKVFGAVALLEDAGGFDPATVVSTNDRGPVDLHAALVKSSNEYFRAATRELGRDRLLDWYEAFGCFRPIPGLISEGSARERRGLARGPDSSLKNCAIGQGSMASSVLEIANMMSTLARRGLRRDPRIVLTIDDRATPPAETYRLAIAEATLSRIFAAMTEIGATKCGPVGRRIGLAAKTGTTELEGVWGELNNAYSAGFAPREGPRIAVAVSLERTPRHGSGTLETLAQIMDLALKRYGARR